MDVGTRDRFENLFGDKIIMGDNEGYDLYRQMGHARSRGKIEAEGDTGHLFNMDAVKGG